MGNERDEPRLGKLMRQVFELLVQTEVVVDDEDGRTFRRAGWLGDVGLEHDPARWDRDRSSLHASWDLRRRGWRRKPHDDAQDDAYSDKPAEGREVPRQHLGRLPLTMGCVCSP